MKAAQTMNEFAQTFLDEIKRLEDALFHILKIDAMSVDSKRAQELMAIVAMDALKVAAKLKEAA